MLSTGMCLPLVVLAVVVLAVVAVMMSFDL